MPDGMWERLIAGVPAGRWGVGVSGGADSVALLLLLAERADLWLHVIHLDHETRAGESAADAKFVVELAEKLRLPVTVEKRSIVESSIDAHEKNTSGRYRQARLALFAQVVSAEQLQGVLLAHHADDQAETVLLRLLRGAAPASVAGMHAESRVRSLLILRPLLAAPRDDLRQFLNSRGQAWREDSSNQSDQYQRNVLRWWLATHPAVRDDLLRLHDASDQLHQWLEVNSPALGESFSVDSLRDVPLPIARHTAFRWLLARGSPPNELSARICERLVQMCTDSAAPARQHFPGNLLIHRRGGRKGVISLSDRQPRGDEGGQKRK